MSKEVEIYSLAFLKNARALEAIYKASKKKEVSDRLSELSELKKGKLLSVKG